MKKYLVLLLTIGFLVIDQLAAKVNVAAGLNFGIGLLNKQQKTYAEGLTGKFKDRTAGLVGLSLTANQSFSKFSIGGYLDVKLCTKKQAYIKNISSELLSVLDSEPKTDYEQTKLMLLFQALKKSISVPNSLTFENADDEDMFYVSALHTIPLIHDNKSIFHKKNKNLISFGINLKYQFAKIYTQLGLGFSHFNAKHNMKKDVTLDEYKHANSALTGQESNWKEGDLADFLPIYNALTEKPSNIVGKIKKNGLEIKGLVGFNVTRNVDVTAQISYITGVKFLHFGLGVMYNF